MDYIIIKNDELYHHGILGQKWGVRRYQNKDGSLTEEGRYQYRAKRAAKTKKDIDALFNKLSREDKRLTGADPDDKEWLSLDAGELVVKRFIKKVGNIPVSALDILLTEKNGELTVATLTDPNYRGKGYASELAKKGVDWFDKNKDILGAEYLDWSAYQDNIASKKIAEKSGFVYDKKNSTDEWASYKHK